MLPKQLISVCFCDHFSLLPIAKRGQPRRPTYPNWYEQGPGIPLLRTLRSFTGDARYLQSLQAQESNGDEFRRNRQRRRGDTACFIYKKAGQLATRHVA